MLNTILFTSYSGKNKNLKRSGIKHFFNFYNYHLFQYLKIMPRRVHCRLIAEGDQGEGWGNVCW